MDYHKDTEHAIPANNINSEEFLWLQLRKRQLQNVEFFRKRAIGNYSVDFYSPAARLVIEVDSPPFDEIKGHLDMERDAYLSRLGLSVLRFGSHEVFDEIEAVLDIIAQTLKLRLSPATSF